MGRTYQVLTGGFLSFHPLRTTMKAVLALLIICLIQISFAENVADDALSVANLLLQREVRDAGKGGCEPGDKKCKRQLRKEKRKEGKKMRKGKKQRKAKTSKTKKGKKGGKGEKKKVDKKVEGKETTKEEGHKKETKKNKTDKKRRQKSKQAKKGQAQDVKGSRSSSANGSGRNTTGQCFTDMVAKTKKFNKAQVEFRLTKRIETWSKLMKNKKNNSASTFSDALDAMNDAT